MRIFGFLELVNADKTQSGKRQREPPAATRKEIILLGMTKRAYVRVDMTDKLERIVAAVARLAPAWSECLRQDALSECARSLSAIVTSLAEAFPEMTEDYIGECCPQTR